MLLGNHKGSGGKNMLVLFTAGKPSPKHETKPAMVKTFGKQVYEKQIKMKVQEQ